MAAAGPASQPNGSYGDPGYSGGAGGGSYGDPGSDPGYSGNAGGDDLGYDGNAYSGGYGDGSYGSHAANGRNSGNGATGCANIGGAYGRVSQPNGGAYGHAGDSGGVLAADAFGNIGDAYGHASQPNGGYGDPGHASDSGGGPGYGRSYGPGAPPAAFAAPYPASQPHAPARPASGGGNGGAAPAIWLALLSFAAPAALLCIAFAAIGIYPFGPGASNTVVIIDNYHQYTPFLMEFGEMLRSGGSLFHSWNAGLGSNFLARFAYYLSSPLNAFSVFFRSGSISEFVLALVLARAGFAGLAFFSYLRAKFGSPSLKTAAFAIMYAMCAFFLAYYWNIMWFDCVAALPLVALGLERLADKGKGMLYCLALGFTILSNYFIAIMVCIYSVLHFAAYYMGKDRGRPAGRRALAAAGRFAIFSALAGGLSAVVSLPAFFGLLRSSAAGADLPKSARIYSDTIDIIANHLMMVKPSIMVGLPNVYCGVAALLLVPLYFMSSRVAFREKLCNALLLAFFLISFNENQLDFLWHGTHFPNSLLFRFSFLYAFFVLSLSYRALISLGGARPRDIFACLAALAALIAFVEARPSEKTTQLAVYISLIFAIIYALALNWIRSIEVAAGGAGAQSGAQSGAGKGAGAGGNAGAAAWAGALAEAGAGAGLGGAGAGEPAIRRSEPATRRGGRRARGRRPRQPLRPRKALLADIAFFVLIGAELTINAGYGIGEAGVFPKDSYLATVSKVRPAVEWAEAREDGFERIEFTEQATYNTPVVYGYKGISYYSSTSYVAVNDMFGRLGLIHSNAWYVYRSSTPVLNSMFAVKYLFSNGKDFDNGIYPLVHRDGEVRVYENPYFLPIGFMVGEDAENWDAVSSNPFAAQEDFIRRAAGPGEPVFARLEPEQGEHSNMTVSAAGSDGLFRYEPADPSLDMKAVHRITALGGAAWKLSSAGGNSQAAGARATGATGAAGAAGADGAAGAAGAAASDGRGNGGGTGSNGDDGGDGGDGGATNGIGCSVYLYIAAQNAQSVTVTNGGEPRRHDIKYPYIIDAESLSPDGTIEIELDFGNSPPGSYTLLAYGFDRAAFAEAHARLASQPLRVASYSDTRLDGEITAEEDGLLFLSVPADDNWTALIDGVPATPAKSGGSASGGGYNSSGNGGSSGNGSSGSAGGSGAASNDGDGAGGSSGNRSGGARRPANLGEGALTTVGGGALMALRLERGNHTISLIYRTKGFAPGLLISLASAALLAALALAPRLAARRRAAGRGSVGRGAARPRRLP
ncbi:MAG: YfhO family protein [Clostridiales bacterium]|nr:YfhO family protein [Clostridiales bacterium]